MNSAGCSRAAKCPPRVLFAKGTSCNSCALRKSGRPGDALAHNAAKLEQVLADVRARGCGARDRDFGGHYDLPRSQANDGRNSIAVPVYAGDEVVGCINLTWIAKVATVPVIIERFLPQLSEAARIISGRMIA